MIKIRLIAVGKVKEDYFRKATEEYIKRLSRFCEFEIAEVKDETLGEKEKILSIEGERIERAARGYKVALAVEGKKYSSEEFAALIKKAIDRGVGEISFIIGGSYGIDERVKNECDAKISFSDMTFPHTMMRVLFTEQLYRAFTIINNAEYHK